MAVPPPPAACWSLTDDSATITNPQSGETLLLTGFVWAVTGTVVSIKVTRLLVTCTPTGASPLSSTILIALTKTGDLVPCTTFHPTTLVADGVQRDLATIDFSLETTFSAADLTSGLVGIIIDWGGLPFTNCDVTISGARIEVGQSAQAGTRWANGLVYGEFDGCDEYLTVQNGGAYTDNGSHVPEANADHWSTNLVPSTTLVNQMWNGAQFLDEIFITNENQGVFRRKICASVDHFLEPLYLNYVNPGSSGAVGIGINPPPYPLVKFDHIVDQLHSGVGLTGITDYNGFPTAPIGTINAATDLITIQITNPVSGTAPHGNTSRYVEFEVALSESVDFSKAPYVILHFTTSGTLNGNEINTRLDFGSTVSNHTLRLGDNATGQYASAAITATAVQTPLDPTSKDFYVWFDLQAIQGSPFLEASLIKIRFAANSFFARGYVYLKELIQGGEFYHHSDTLTMLLARPESETTSGGPLVYAYNYTEGAIGSPSTNAHTISIPAATHMGSQSQTSLPFNGSIVTLTIPTAPTPFTTAALIHAYRKIADNYYEIAVSADSVNDFVLTDHITDYDILYSYSFTVAGLVTGPKFGDTYTNNGHTYKIISAPAAGAGTIVATSTGGAPQAAGNLTRTSGTGDALIAFSANAKTYPLTALSFAAITPDGSGQVTGVVNMCHFKYSMIYFLATGEACGSQTNFAQNVLWPGVVLDFSLILPNARPRTLHIAENRGLPVLVGVGQSVLYMFTRKEGYTMRTLTTFAEADFPAKTSGVLGAVGTKAACAFSAGALFGSDSGLYYVAVNPYQPTISTEPPDQLVEVTKLNRGLWARLIGTAVQRESLVVRSSNQDIWCLCGNRFMHISKNGGQSYGEWANGKSVVEACGDPYRGVVMLFSDGTLGVCGDYPTDGGTNITGTNGSPPSWYWRGKRHTAPMRVLGARAVFENDTAGQPNLGTVTVFSQRGSLAGDVVAFDDPGGVMARPFDESIVQTMNAVGGDWFEVLIAGSAYDKFTRVDLHVVAGQPKRFSRS